MTFGRVGSPVPAVALAVLAGAAVLLSWLATTVAPAASRFSDTTGPLPSTWQAAEAFGLRFETVTAGDRHSCAIDPTGDAWCWGDASGGLLGIGTSGGSYAYALPVVKPAGMGALVDISTAHGYTCAVDEDGEAWCWGTMNAGQAGNGITSQIAESPVEVSRQGAAGFVGIAAGEEHTCAVDGAGVAWCWGGNSNGQLGIGGTSPSNIPMAVTSTVMGTSATSIAVGRYHSCAVSGEQAYCWGQQRDGRLGNASVASGVASSPVAVSSGSMGAVSRIRLGATHSCAVTVAGTLWCWGDNGSGQLGNDSTTSSSVPVQISAAGTVVSLDGGMFHTCATDDGGTARCWGGNGHGQIGDGSQTQRHVPTLVTTTTMSDPIVFIAGGVAHTCVADQYGAAWCWGNNGNNRLGSPGGNTSAPRQVALEP